MSENNPLSHPEPSPALEDLYTFGYSPTAVQIMTSRTAEDSARFFLPYLHTGMRVLDCGCGPESITVGLAQAVAPGEVVGIDVEPSQIALAQTSAAERGMAHARFETSNIAAMPFPDDAFDAAFGHTIVMRCRDPVQALTEVYRVVKPGGGVGFRAGSTKRCRNVCTRASGSSNSTPGSDGHDLGIPRTEATFHHGVPATAARCA